MPATMVSVFSMVSMSIMVNMATDSVRFPSVQCPVVFGDRNMTDSS